METQTSEKSEVDETPVNMGHTASKSKVSSSLDGKTSEQTKKTNRESKIIRL